MKWSDLYDSYKQEGIRDAIKVYEYMNRYYVQEGNKRVSVSHYGGTDPFSGEIHTRDGRVIRAQKVDSGRDGAMVLSPTPPEQIFEIDWINENIEGEVEM